MMNFLVETESENKQLALHHLVTEIYYIPCLQFVFTFWAAYPAMWLIARFIGFLSMKKLGRIHSKNLPQSKVGCGRGLLIYPRINNNVDLFLQKNCDSLPN